MAMSLFGVGKTTNRYGVIIDIGSGSVLTAIVHSDQKQKHPQIIWSHREPAPLRNIDSLEQSAKAVTTALVNASILLDGEGRKALHDYNHGAKLTEMQCSIAAPWSYTVTKTINYSQDEPFNITEELIEELTRTIQTKIETELKEDEALHNFGLEITTRANMDMLSNGYRVANPEGNRAKTFTFSRTSAISQKYLVEAVDEMHDKLFPSTDCRKLSFILMLFRVTRDFFANNYDVCLVDITYEATEIGVVRDGTLSYCTHTPFGLFSLAREISKITNVPLHEAFGYFHTDKPYAFMESLSKAQHEDVEAVFEAYTERINKLFEETGDSLAIPKKITLHADLESESVFVDLIEKAAKRSLKTEPHIIPISKEIIRQTYDASTKNAKETVPADTALLLSAQFFHKQQQRQCFEYL